MSLHYKPQQKTDYRLEKIDDEILLYHPNQTRIIYCNTTASLIWQLCDGQRTGQEIANILSAVYEQTIETITVQVIDVLQLFCRHGAIQYLNSDGQLVSPATQSG